MDMIKPYVGMTVDVEISAEKKINGVLIEVGPDIIVIFNGSRFVYIPANHIKNVQLVPGEETQSSEPPQYPNQNEKQISYRKILTNSKGTFAEIYVSGNLSIHGYITHIMTNYFEFYSPIYKTMFVPLFHLKWLIPYNFNQTPYLLDKRFLPVQPSDMSLSRTFEEQVKKFEGKIVIFDLGAHANKMGLLQKIDNQIVELITAEGKKLYTNIQHIKVIHAPSM